MSSSAGTAPAVAFGEVVVDPNPVAALAEHPRRVRPPRTPPRLSEEPACESVPCAWSLVPPEETRSVPEAAREIKPAGRHYSPRRHGEHGGELTGQQDHRDRQDLRLRNRER